MNDSPHPPATLKLLAEAGSEEQTWTLGGRNSYVIGRIAANDIPLPYSWVSRKHAMIQAEENGRLNLIDLGSSNGTFVNGRRIHTPIHLQNGDCVGIGNTRLLFHQEPAGNQPAATPEADLDEMTVAFVRKETITILICDIHDYTQLSEVMGDQRLSQFLQYWTGKVSKLVHRHEGIVDKFIGDAVMALWPGPDLCTNIHLALKTALAINIFTRNLSSALPDLPWSLQTGAALNTGEAMLGNLAQNGQHNYTVVGDVVNVAFRLEDMTCSQDGLDLLMGSDAARHLVEPAPFFTRRQFQLKGKNEPVEAYGCSFSQLAAYLEKNATVSGASR